MSASTNASDTAVSSGQLPLPRRSRRRELPTAEVGPFVVVDASQREVIEYLSTPAAVRTVAFALHVGGLNDRDDERFVAAMRRADVVYADGKSVELVARAAGAQQIQRAATTDIGLPALAALSRRLGRPARVAVVGAKPGVADLAARAIEAAAGTETVLVAHGYQQDWTPVLAHLRAARPDAVIVGLGMPLEACWVDDHREDLPPALILTCGGWLGFLAGEESRAPQLAQRSGAEWMYRLRQQPRHLGPRYARGLVTFARLYLTARLTKARLTKARLTKARLTKARITRVAR